MKLSSYAKAIAAFLSGAVAPLAALYAANGTLTSSDLIAALVTAVVSAGSVWKVKNAGTTVAGLPPLVVTLSTDFEKFKAAFVPAFDAAVKASVVIAPQPVPVTVTTNSGAVLTSPTVFAQTSDAPATPDPTPPVAGV